MEQERDDDDKETLSQVFTETTYIILFQLSRKWST